MLFFSSFDPISLFSKKSIIWRGKWSMSSALQAHLMCSPTWTKYSKPPSLRFICRISNSGQGYLSTINLWPNFFPNLLCSLVSLVLNLSGTSSFYIYPSCCKLFLILLIISFRLESNAILPSFPMVLGFAAVISTPSLFSDLPLFLWSTKVYSLSIPSSLSSVPSTFILSFDNFCLWSSSLRYFLEGLPLFFLRVWYP